MSKNKPVQIDIEFIKLDERAITPTYATPLAAGIDFYSIISKIIHPGELETIQTGIALSIPNEYQLMITGRSGLSRQGILYQSSGLIDPDYRGELIIPLRNTTDKPCQIEEGHRIAQGYLQLRTIIRLIETKELSKTRRGSNGFGSTGK